MDAAFSKAHLDGCGFVEFRGFLLLPGTLPFDFRLLFRPRRTRDGHRLSVTARFFLGTDAFTCFPDVVEPELSHTSWGLGIWLHFVSRG